MEKNKPQTLPHSTHNKITQNESKTNIKAKLKIPDKKKNLHPGMRRVLSYQAKSIYHKRTEKN